jgi:hypothetical protein
MVAIIKCTRDEMERLEWSELLHNKRGEEWLWQPTRRRKTWDSGSHLTLVLDTRPAIDVISKLGWTTRLRRAGDLDQVLEVSRIEPVDPPVPYNNVVRRLAGRFTTHLVEEGQLPEGTGRALIDALTQERPDLTDVMARIEGVAEKYHIRDSPAGQVLALQRDASIVAVRMAGMGVSDLARWDRPPAALSSEDVPPNFAGRIPGGKTIEDRQIDHDARTMLGWLTGQTGHLSWRTFSGFGQRLLVANANHETAEATLGVDLIYYNLTRESLILVQYKKFDAAKNGYYYPDSDPNLARELIRMRAVSRYAARHTRVDDDFRLDSRPCWIKLCPPQAFIPQTADMVPGMYFSLDHFERLRADPRLKGPRGGTRFGYTNVPSYLDNTMFSRLAEIGLIGTSGTSSDLVHQQVIRSFNGHKALVLATLHGEEMPQSKRNTEKRRLLQRH